MISDSFAGEAFSAGIPVPILGVPFDKVTLTDTVQRVEQMIARRRPHYIVTPNVDFIVQAQEDAELRRILFDADLVLCDGTPVLWISRFLRNPLPERVAGSDLVPLLIERAAEKGYRIFLLGASPEAAEQAVTNLQTKYPNLIIAGHYSPPFSPLLEMDHQDIAHRIQEAKPDMLFVSFGCPKQEKWIQMNYRSLGVPVSIGVGATIDFLAGHMKRAPVWMQRTGTEWIFRMLQEPRRLFKRYAKDIWVFGWRMLVQCSQSPLTTLRSRDMDLEPRMHWEQNRIQITLPTQWHGMALRDLALPWEQIAKGGIDLVLDANGVEAIDNAGAGLLVRLKKILQANGHRLILFSPPKAIERMLAGMRLNDFFLFSPDRTSAQRLMETQARETAAPVQSDTAAASPLLWRGEITAANADEVWTATAAHVTASMRNELAIDLSNVTFIDSTGVDLMLKAAQLARSKKATLTFIHSPATVQNVLRHTRFEMLLQKLPDIPETTTSAAHELVLAQQA